jgi:dihydroneopterin aldolase
MSMSKISIVDLEVFFKVGVTDEERANPQRLLVTVVMDYDFSVAAKTDRLMKTIDYYQVAQGLLKFGEHRSWRLIEKLVTDISDMVLVEFRPRAVHVEVKKFVIPQAAYVSVSLSTSA